MKNSPDCPRRIPASALLEHDAVQIGIMLMGRFNRLKTRPITNLTRLIAGSLLAAQASILIVAGLMRRVAPVGCADKFGISL